MINAISKSIETLHMKKHFFQNRATQFSRHYQLIDMDISELVLNFIRKQIDNPLKLSRKEKSEILYINCKMNYFSGVLGICCRSSSLSICIAAQIHVQQHVAQQSPIKLP